MSTGGTFGVLGPPPGLALSAPPSPPCSASPIRYINHSCAPNCVAEVVTFDKEDKIIIISSRRIPKGEEVRGAAGQRGGGSVPWGGLGAVGDSLLPPQLTYDYQFDFEDDQHKIPCHCGAWNCRKWMN